MPHTEHYHTYGELDFRLSFCEMCSEEGCVFVVRNPTPRRRSLLRLSASWVWVRVMLSPLLAMLTFSALRKAAFPGQVNYETPERLDGAVTVV